MEVQGVRQEAASGVATATESLANPGAFEACGLNGVLPPKSSTVCNCHPREWSITCCNKFNGIDLRGSGTH